MSPSRKAARTRRLRAAKRRKAALKAARTLKWRGAKKKADLVTKNAKTFAKYQLTRAHNYKSLYLDKGHGATGIVDMIAVKRSSKDRDRLDIVLVQVKGGSAKIKKKHIRRLQLAAKHSKISWGVATKPGRALPSLFISSS